MGEVMNTKPQVTEANTNPLAALLETRKDPKRPNAATTGLAECRTLTKPLAA
jgi:hypothetical protein